MQQQQLLMQETALVLTPPPLLSGFAGQANTRFCEVDPWFKP